MKKEHSKKKKKFWEKLWPERFERIVLILGCCAIVAYLFLSACGEVSSAQFSDTQDYFVALYKYTPSYDITVTILVDRETRVMYAQEVFKTSYKGGITLTPLYKANGELLTYQGDLPK